MITNSYFNQGDHGLLFVCEDDYPKGFILFDLADQPSMLQGTWDIKDNQIVEHQPVAHHVILLEEGSLPVIDNRLKGPPRKGAKRRPNLNKKSSLPLGVHASGDGFRAQFMVDGERYGLSGFKTPEEAAKWYWSEKTRIMSELEKGDQ